jgi:lipopolysaccharide export system permease protein
LPRPGRLKKQRPNDSAAKASGPVSPGARKLKGNAVLRFGILQRYILGDVLRAFLLALTTITGIFVLFMIMAEAARLGLSPRDIAALVPYVIPGSLPYTIPVSLLFAVTVVFGRIASDNEVIAVKSAGLSAMTVLLPAYILGAFLSGSLLGLSNGLIPIANHKAKLVIFENMEEMFYKILKKDREFNNPRWPFLITVKDVQGKEMLGATFKRRRGGGANPNEYDLIIQASKATLKFDTDGGMVHVYLDGAEISDPREDVVLINGKELEIPIPSDNKLLQEKRIQEWTTAEMVAEQARLRDQIANERRRQAIEASLYLGLGRVGRINWAQVQRAFIDFGYWNQRLNEFETEKQMRIALACGSLFFVLLGAPVGILFARGDFLSAFITCFVPIILVYYPLTLLAVNVGKDGLMNPTVALWAGNTVLGILAGLVLPSVIRH